MEAGVKENVDVEQLKKVLEESGNSWHWKCDTLDFYINISQSIKELSKYALSDPYLIRDWVWINAQFRIHHPSNEYVARSSWAALTLFISIAAQLEDGSQEIISEIRWLTDKSVEMLLGQLGSQEINNFISPAELKEIDDKLLELAETEGDDLEILKDNARVIAKEFSTIHHAAYFPTIADKLVNLCKISHESTEAGYWAKAALRYVCLEEDVINDSQGYIGFLDDIHVIENMHSFVFGELPWKRLIDQASEKWPFITRAYWLDKNFKNHLTPLLKAVISCCLDSSLEQNQSRTIVLTDIGPCGFLAAAAFVLIGDGSDRKRTVPEPGTLALFRDGHISRYVMMEPPFKQSDGSELPMVRLRNNHKRSILQDKAILLEPVNGNVSIALATSKQFERWLSVTEEDSQPVIHKLQSVNLKTSVLYVTSRSGFFSYIETILPYGHRLDGLVSVEYRSRVNCSSLSSRTLSANSKLIVCSSLDVAEGILRDEMDHFKPQYMIVDRPVNHVFLEALKERCKQYAPNMKVIVFSTVNTKVGIYPKKQEESVWLIRPDDIDPVPKTISSISVSDEGKGYLAKYVKRQAQVSSVKLTTHVVEFVELETFYQVSKKIKQRAFGEDSSLLPFAFSSETVLKHISEYPPTGNNIVNEQLSIVLVNLYQNAAAMGIYDKDLECLAAACNELIEAIKIKNPKTQVLPNLIKGYEECHIAVSSRCAAESLSRTILNLGDTRVRFISVHDLEELGAIELLLIPGWLGNKEMQRLFLGGWSSIQLNIFYDFEYQRSSKQTKKLDDIFISLAEKTRESWKAFAIKNPEVGHPPVALQKPVNSESKQETNELVKEKEILEYEDWMESAVRGHIKSSSINENIQTQVCGRLIFFNDRQHYGVFADNSKVVCLNEVLGESLNADEVNESEAEQLLRKNVKHLEIGDILAFPDDPMLEDVIDGLADAILNDNGNTRMQSALWRKALRDIYEGNACDLDKTQGELLKYGVERTCATIGSWLNSAKTVAPRNPYQTIPNILACAGIENFKEVADNILKYVNKIYEVRRKASHFLVAQLSTASISDLGDSAFIKINEKEIRYKILSISSIDEAIMFDASFLGVHSFYDGLPEVQR